jgi:hypothetical protein
MKLQGILPPGKIFKDEFVFYYGLLIFDLSNEALLIYRIQNEDGFHP